MQHGTLIEPYGGTARAVLHAAAEFPPRLVAWMGSKGTSTPKRRSLAAHTLAALGHPPGSGFEAALLIDASSWGWVWPLLLDANARAEVIAVVRGWIGRDPVELWNDLRGAGKPERPPAAAASWLWLQARSASGVPVWWEGDDLLAGRGLGRPPGRATQKGTVPRLLQASGRGGPPQRAGQRGGTLSPAGPAGQTRRRSGLVWPRTLVARLEGLGELDLERVEVIHGRCEDVHLSALRHLPRPWVVILDPPYVRPAGEPQPTSYGVSATWGGVIREIARWAALADVVAVHHSLPLGRHLSGLWHSLDVTPLGAGKPEWITMNQPPAPGWTGGGPLPAAVVHSRSPPPRSPPPSSAAIELPTGGWEHRVYQEDVDIFLDRLPDRMAETDDPFASLILADPPWSFEQRRVRGAVSDYEVMKMGDIIGSLMAARSVAAKRAYLVVWICNALLSEFFAVPSRLRDAWPWRFLGVYTWAKTQIGCGHHLRNTTEQALLFSTRQGGAQGGARNVRNMRVHPRLEHSRKPVACAADLIAGLTAPGDVMVELFAGKWAPGCEAAHHLGRRAYGCEIAPERHAHALRHLRERAGKPLKDGGPPPDGRTFLSGHPDVTELLGLSKSALLLLLLVEQRRDLLGRSAAELGRMINTTDRQVRRGLAELRRMGFIASADRAKAVRRRA